MTSVTTGVQIADTVLLKSAGKAASWGRENPNLYFVKSFSHFKHFLKKADPI